MFFCTLLYVHSSIAIILMGKRELVALLGLSSWCLVMVKRLFLAVPRGCLQFVIVVFPDHTHLLFLKVCSYVESMLNSKIKLLKNRLVHRSAMGDGIRPLPPPPPPPPGRQFLKLALKLGTLYHRI